MKFRTAAVLAIEQASFPELTAGAHLCITVMLYILEVTLHFSSMGYRRISSDLKECAFQLWEATVFVSGGQDPPRSSRRVVDVVTEWPGPPD